VREVGTCPKVQQEALQSKQRDDHLEGGMTAAQIGVNEMAVEIVLFMSSSQRMLLLIWW
jgi:hypothetical protein